MIKKIVLLFTWFFILLSIASAEDRGIDKISLPADGLVAFYPFDNNTDDVSNYGNHGTGINNPGYAEDRHGSEAGALSLNGRNQYVQVAADESLNLTGSLTIAVWVYPEYLDDVWKGIITKAPQSSTWNGYGLRLAASRPVASIQVSGRQGPDWGTSTSITTERWYFLAMVYNHNNKRVDLYINNTIVSGGYAAGSVNNSAAWPLRIGRDGSDLGGRHFKGRIDDARIYDKALSPKEIELLYNEGLEAAVDNTMQNSPGYKVGGIGPAGGYVFYDKGSYSDGWRYLEAAPADTEWDNNIEWGGFTYSVKGTAAEIGSGKSNTDKIVQKLGNYEPFHNRSDYAAKLCADLIYGGYDDWFLPSKDELNMMYENLKQNDLGNFAGSWYWSSSQSSTDKNRAWGQTFYSGNQSDKIKYDHSIRRVRAVRAF
jgi:hypothetical protein